MMQSKRHIALFISFILFTNPVFADIFSDNEPVISKNEQTRIELPPLKEKQYQPFTPTKHTGKVAFTLTADYVEVFSDGLGLVKTNGRYGFVDQTGEFAIKPQFDNAKPFSEGLAAVLINGKWGFINKKGKVVIKPQFWHVDEFHEGMAGVTPDRKHPDCYINQQGDIQFCSDALVSIFQFSEGLVRIRRSLYGKSGFIDKQGNVIIPEKFDHADVFHDGLVRVRKNGAKFSQSKFGFANHQGQMVIPFQYDDVYDFSDGLAAVQVGEQWGFINRTGEMVIPAKYNDASPFSEGLAKVELNDKAGFINKTGNLMVPLQYDYAQDFSNGLAQVQKTYGSPIQFIDRTGTVQIQIDSNNETWPEFSNGLLIERTSPKEYRYIRSQ